MPTEYADALSCSGSHVTNTYQFKSHNVIALRHVEQRMRIESSQPSLGLGAGMAPSLRHLLLPTENYETKIESEQQIY